MSAPWHGRNRQLGESFMRRARRCGWLSWLSWLLVGCSLVGHVKPSPPPATSAVAHLVTLAQPQQRFEGLREHRGLFVDVFVLDGRMRPMPADGALAFFAYFDDGTPSVEAAASDAAGDPIAAEARWLFPADQLGLYRRESPIGTHYVFWLPFSPREKEPAAATLFTCLVTADGRRSTSRNQVRLQTPFSRYETLRDGRGGSEAEPASGH